MAEERLYVRIRAPNAETGSWRFSNASSLSYEIIVRCPKCEHGCIMKPWNTYDATDTPPRLHCRSCGHYHVFRNDREEDKELYQKLTAKINLYYQTLFEGKLLFARNRDHLDKYIDFIGSANPQVPMGHHGIIEALPQWVLSADTKKMMKALQKMWDLPPV
eukprot:TRINITY_DN10277_c0_g1_i1.p1 TRINITY_DN10277_c0_g1~~TRINITY_DN10277_c0_g1_i1.p1  ORF type:complete len:174 (-),score=14.52 TRINITY_DN10277_c0_g1_i1:236-718(-)